MKHSILKGNLTNGASKGVLVHVMPPVARPVYQRVHGTVVASVTRDLPNG